MGSKWFSGEIIDKNIVIAAVVVVVIVAVIGAFIVVSRGGGVLGTLPVYPGAQETNDNIAQQAITSLSLPSGWVEKAYTTAADPQTVIDWYKTQMSGWTKGIDSTTQWGNTTAYILGCVKESDEAMIFTFAYGNSNYVILAAGPNPQWGPGGENQQGGQFSISTSPSSVTIPRGGSENVTLSYEPEVPSNLGMNLSTSGPGPGIQIEIDPPFVFLVVVVSENATLGTYTVAFEVTDLDTGARATTTFTVIVTEVGG